MGTVSTFFLSWLIVNITLAWLSGNWRLKIVAFIFFGAWLIPIPEGVIQPIFDVAISLLQIIAFQRIQLKRPNDEKLCWWMVAIISAEILIFILHFILPFYFVYSGIYVYFWCAVTFLFVIQLATIFYISFMQLFYQNKNRLTKHKTELILGQKLLKPKLIALSTSKIAHD